MRGMTRDVLQWIAFVIYCTRGSTDNRTRFRYEQFPQDGNDVRLLERTHGTKDPKIGVHSGRGQREEIGDWGDWETHI